MAEPREVDLDTALETFHDQYAGGSDEVFGRATREDGRTSYAWLADQVSEGPVLDLACGDGPLTALFVERGLEVEALDRNASELAKARARNPGVPHHQGAAQALPFEAGRFRGVACHMALMLMRDGDAVIAEVKRVLAPGGVFAGVVGGRPVRTPVMEGFVEEILPLVRSHVRIRYPGEDWDGDGLEARLDGWSVEQEEFRTDQRVPVELFRGFCRQYTYGNGLLEGEARERADALADRIARDHAVDGAVAWAWRFHGFRAVRPA